MTASIHYETSKSGQTAQRKRVTAHTARGVVTTGGFEEPVAL